MQRTRTIGTVTDDCYHTITQPGLLSSTPIKRVPDHSQLTPCKTDSSFASDDDSKDLTFVIENIENEDDDMEQSDTVDNGLEGTTYRSRIVDEPKIIVFESKLNELLNSLTCSECLCPVKPSDTVKEYIGSAIKGRSQSFSFWINFFQNWDSALNLNIMKFHCDFWYCNQ